MHSIGLHSFQNHSFRRNEIASGCIQRIIIKTGVVYQTKDHINHSVWGDFINRSFFSYESNRAEVEIRQFNMESGDRVFLCTDGISSYVDPDILKERLLDNKTPEEIIDVIEFLAERGSQDNYSGCLVYYE